jgi:hypothetical protein
MVSCTGIGSPSPLVVTVVSQSEQPVTAMLVAATFDGGLTLIPPAGLMVQLVAQDGGVRCRATGSPPTRLGCSVLAAGSVTFTTVVEDDQPERVPLFGHCNHVALTWPSGTETTVVAAAIDDQVDIVAIWRYDNATGRFHGWSPLVGAATDLVTVNRLDAVFICMRAPATLTRPQP